MDRHNTVVKTHLRKLKILPKEWEVLSQLTKVLSVCQFSTFASWLHLTPILSSPSWKQHFDSPKRRSHFFMKSFPSSTFLPNEWMTSPAIEHTSHQYKQEPPRGLLCSINTMWRQMNQSCTDVLWVRATYYPTCFSTYILILIQPGSTSSQVQTGILPGEEMAWRLGWHGKSCITRAMVNELQATWSIRTCVSGVWLVIVISELSFYLWSECLDLILILMWYRLWGTVYSHRLMTSAPMTCLTSLKNT